MTELLELGIPTIIDVSLPSPNVDWEMKTAAEHISPGKLLLIRAASGSEAELRVSQESSWAIIHYDITQAVDELTVFNRSWQDDKHQLMNPDARLGATGSAIASAIKEWMQENWAVSEKYGRA